MKSFILPVLTGSVITTYQSETAKFLMGIHYKSIDDAVISLENNPYNWYKVREEIKWVYTAICKSIWFKVISNTTTPVSIEIQSVFKTRDYFQMRKRKCEILVMPDFYTEKVMLSLSSLITLEFFSQCEQHDVIIPKLMLGSLALKTQTRQIQKFLEIKE